MFNHALFAASIAAHCAQHKLSLRDAAKECGVSASTLSRLIRGETLDMVGTFVQLCAWMEIAPGAFFEGAENRAVAPLAQAIAALRSDPALDKDSCEKVVALVEAAYNCMAQRSEYVRLYGRSDDLEDSRQ